MTSTSSSSNRSRRVAIPPAYDNWTDNEKAKFLIEDVYYKLDSPDIGSDLSTALGYAGGKDGRDVGKVLGGTARGMAGRVASLQNVLETRGYLYRVTSSSKNSRSRGNNNNNNSNDDAVSQSSGQVQARAKNLIDLCLENGKSLKEISLWLQFSGLNGKRDVGTALEGGSRDMAWRLDCLQVEMEEEGLLEQDHDNDNDQEEAKPLQSQSQRPSQPQPQQQQQQQPQNTANSNNSGHNIVHNVRSDNVVVSNRTKQSLKCDLPIGRRPILRLVTAADLHDAFDDDDDDNDDSALKADDSIFCPVCNDELKIGDKIAETVLCQHLFHQHCVAKWFSRDNSSCCPHCGQDQMDGVAADRPTSDDAAASGTRPSGPQPSAPAASASPFRNQEEEKRREQEETEAFIQPPSNSSLHVHNLNTQQMQKVWNDAISVSSPNNNSNNSSNFGAFQNEPEQVGQGASARIFKGLFSSLPATRSNSKNKNNNIDDEYIAIKIFNRSGSYEEFKKELDILTSLPEHDNILRPLAFCAAPEWKCIIFPFYEAIQIDRKNSVVTTAMSGMQRLAILFDLALAVEYLHSTGATSKKTKKKESRIAHRDIKVENILLAPRQPQKRAILADLGSARRESDRAKQATTRSAAAVATMTRVIGTSIYLDYELIAYAQKHNSASLTDGAFLVPSSMYFPADIYSLGVTFAILICGRVPVTNAQRQDMIVNYLPNGDFAGLRTSGLVELVQDMTLKAGSLRPTAAQVVERLRQVASAALSDQQKTQIDKNMNRPFREIMCQSCRTAQRNCAFQPCGHKLYCEDCIKGCQQATLMNNGCPLCSATIVGWDLVNPQAPTKCVVARK